MEDEIPQIQPVSPETIAHETVATPIVHVTQPVSSQSDKAMERLEDSYHQLTLKLGEMSGKLDAMVSRVPEPVAPGTRENELNDTETVADSVKDDVPDAVTLTVDDKATKPAKVQPQAHKRKGLRRSR